MTSTRKLDQAIRVAEFKLAGVRRRDLSALPAREQAKMAGHVGAVIAKGVRGQQPSRRADRGIDLIWQNAEARLLAEISAAQSAKQQVINKDAKAKTDRKAQSKGWW
ncbi:MULTISPECIES: hypothetical protein [Streptomyces]|uniref:hypothetical protein n=1 Tax=Streptomyces TaxID=1883 RepID=UPI00226EF0CA|nr:MULTISPECIES: hypothetical protein [unclassified Streptomyces]MCY0923708.1 hypothetical protein [Streptomyces sp. H27-G5]MCY0947737.1 hypothetical protein [Streptomyces sp. H34-AA3]MCZ4088475.1 hypothetical protein [Streptomyces sp. H34-S5]MDJ0466990.1 hypothetical protein [Streptomyces sp. H27-C3]